jgi:Rieske [2Fe-2S] domain
MEFVETINESELINGTSKVISVKGKDIALFRIDNKITALGNSCLHKGGPLTKGKIEKNMIAIMLLVLGMDGNTIFRMERHHPVMMSSKLFMMYK